MVARKDTRVMIPGHRAPSHGVGASKVPPSTQSSRAEGLGDGLRSNRDQQGPPKAGGVQVGRVPKTSTTTDRKKQLEEWLASKGRKYKRPPMTLLQKQERVEDRINTILTECLELTEKGVHAEELSTVLALVPQAQRFAKFWICQAKLKAREGPFDVTGLYKSAVCAGAQPLQELREVVLEILKASDQTLE
ncbi:PREDICTED: cytoskeleton-associated protein 2-like, partial [Acanthisitta chloris]|uniref:cytoskeleton-associated protein 2-like n=1 Tax=Acanthisitta chloris TaxID=57068 RepID=UPI0004F0EBD9